MQKQQLRDQLKDSMIARDETKTSVLRMLISAITYYEINKGGAGYEASDEDVLNVIQKEVKQRRDSIEQFEKANRHDLAGKEKKELEILQEYLPQEMSEEEITTLVKQAVSQSGATSMQDIGKVMGILIPQVKGKADGTLVSQIVKKELATKE